MEVINVTIDNNKKSFLNSIKLQLLIMGLVPLILLGIISLSTAKSSLENGLKDQSMQRLKSICVAVRASYTSLNDEPYSLNEDGELMKGDYNISAHQEDIDAYVKGIDADVTLFYGDVRMVTSLKDTVTGERIIGTSATPELSAKVLNGEDYSSTSVMVNGQNYYAYYMPMYNPNGSVAGMVFVGEPSAHIDTYINSRSMSMITITVLVLAVAVIYALFMAFRIEKAIGYAKTAVDNLAQGNLAYQVSDVLLRRKDEIGDMGRSVSRCVNEVRTVVENIQNFSQEVLSSGDDLEKMASQTNQNAGNIASAMDDISRGAVMQAEDIENATTKIGDMGNMIRNIVANISDLNNTSETMQNAGTEAADIMEGLSESNDKTVAAILKVAENVETTDASVRNISDAVELISNVAEQTNLLSLNASIEAARAGDAGKGFAVVAMEIQKLSSESNDSAQKISQIITQLSADSHNSLTMMEEVKRRLQEQQEKLNATKNQFGNVNNGIISSREGTNAINGQAKICDQSRSSVVDIITNLSAVSQENVASTEETTASMQQLNAAIDLVAEASIRLKNLAVSLTEATKFFQL